MDAIEYMKLNPIVKYTPKVLKKQDADEEVFSDDSDLDNTQTQLVGDPIRDKLARQIDASKNSPRGSPQGSPRSQREEPTKVKPGVHTRFDQFAPRPKGNPDKYN
jgi:hypothetical protein